MPASLGRAVLNSKFLNRILSPLFQAGRHVETTSLHWFLMLRFVASMRHIRPRSLRYVEEQERIEEWLRKVMPYARREPDRTGDVSGKRVSVHVVSEGARNIKKTKI